jgi:hypothetical protein
LTRRARPRYHESMAWSTIYLVLAIIVAVLGIWNIARSRSVFLSLIGIVWFVFVLFERWVPEAYRFVIVRGMPSVGSLLQYLVIPILLVVAFFTGSRR